MFTIRPMLADDIPAGLVLCRASGWNQVARDWEQFLSLNPDGARVAIADGRVVGSVTTLNYDGQFGWIAMVLVDPSQRGRGIGTAMLTAGLQLLEPLPVTRLDATPAGHGIYVGRGFTDEYRLVRFERRSPNADERAASGLPTTASDVAVRPLREPDWSTVHAWDADVFGADRRAMLGWLWAGAPDYAWVAEDQRGLSGYMLGRSGFAWEHLGPVVARDDRTAAALVSMAIDRHRAPFLIDAPLHSPAWRAWLEHAGFREQRRLTRMRRGGPATIGRPDEQFAIVGPEFG
jgi:GNAT superfamily N-acetyltransferase